MKVQSLDRTLGEDVTPRIMPCVAYLEKGTLTGRQFGWGGTPLKRYQWRPKVDSDRSEIGCRVQGHKSA